jgi:diguanylate cyclase (GGDEF)-like protein
VLGDATRRVNTSVLIVGAAAAAISAGLWALLLRGEGHLDGPIVIDGVWLGAAFFVCELFGLRVERTHGEHYGYTLAFVPLAVGLAYSEPTALILAITTGSLLALLVLRQRRPLEMVYELAVHAMQASIAVVVFRPALGDADLVSGRGVSAMLAALAVAFLSAQAPLSAVVTLVGGRWPGNNAVARIFRTGAVAALLNMVIGIGLTTAMWQLPYEPLLLTAILLAGLACNQAYRGLAHRYKGLEIHYEFVSSVVRSSDLSEITYSVLAAARKLLRANDALLLLRPAGDGEPARRIRLSAGGPETIEVAPAQHLADVLALMPRQAAGRVPLDATAPQWLREMTTVSALAAPITASDGSVVGALVVSQSRRKAINSFGAADATLLGTLASQASVAIENGLLFHQLEREAADRAHQATHDSLTGLPNRVLLTDILGAALDQAYATRERVGLLIVDLDSFSQVVDAFGHRSADGLLIQACGRIRGLLPESATLARLSGEQFAIVMPGVEDSDSVIGAARLLIAGFDPPFQSEGVLLALSVNVGIAIYPEQAIDAASLVQRAHIAADTARRHRSGWELYDPLHDPATPRRLALAADLREALETDGLDVCFQPKVELASGIVRGAEALVRWNHPRLGRVRPDEFITIAEHTGDIRTLTMVVMRKALAECRRWRDSGLDMSVAVNLSARNLLDLHLVADVAAAIDEAGIPPSAMTLELTESMVMSESQRSLDVLTGLNELGVQLSCDDFGTGYSSLAHLRRLPIGEIKIDKSFIASMAVDESDRAIARSVLALGRDLGLVTVAEGVESREGWDLLVALGCDMAQGFVVCPPLTPHQFDDWLDRRQPTEFAYLDDMLTPAADSGRGGGEDSHPGGAVVADDDLDGGRVVIHKRARAKAVPGTRTRAKGRRTKAKVAATTTVDTEPAGEVNGEPAEAATPAAVGADIAEEQRAEVGGDVGAGSVEALLADAIADEAGPRAAGGGTVDAVDARPGGGAGEPGDGAGEPGDGDDAGEGRRSSARRASGQTSGQG